MKLRIEHLDQSPVIQRFSINHLKTVAQFPIKNLPLIFFPSDLRINKTVKLNFTKLFLREIVQKSPPKNVCTPQKISAFVCTMDQV